MISKKKVLIYTTLLLYQFGLGASLYGGYLLILNAPLSISINPFYFLALIIAFPLMAFLVFLILAIDYLVLKYGTDFVFKTKTRKLKNEKK